MKEDDKPQGQLAKELETLRRRIAELEAAGGEASYSSLADSIADVFFAMDKDLRYTYWNKASEKLTGIAAKEALGKRLFDIFPDTEWTRKAAEAYLTVLKTKQPLTFTNEIQLHGKSFICEISAYPTDVGVSVFVKDITERKRTEEAFRQSEEKYRTILKTALDGFIIIDLNAKLLEVNDSYCQMLGYTREELLKMSVPDIDILSSPGEVAQRIKKMITQGPDCFETRHRCKDGRIIDVEVSTNYLDIEQGQFFIFCRDITERKRLEEYLEKEQQELSLIIDSSPIIVFYKDREGKLVRVNKAFAEAINIPEEEFVGKTVFDLYSTKIAQDMTIDDQEVLESGRPKLNIIEKYESASGTRWVQTDKVPIFDKNGIAIGLVGFAQDITEQKQAEEMLRVSEARYRLLAENVRDVIWAMDMDLRFTYVSPSIRFLDGRTAEEVVSLSLEQLLTPSSCQLALEIFAEELAIADITAQDPTRSRTLEVELIRRDGSILWAELKINFMRDAGGRPIGILGVMRDITERKRAEEERREWEQKAQMASRLSSVGELAAGIAHEINNPLTGVIGYAELLMQEDVPEHIRNDLEIIHDGAKRVAGVVKGLLTFARQNKPERTLVDINQIIETTLRLRAYELETSNIKVTTKLDPGLPITVADPGQLQQVFLNLIVNAETEMKLARGRGKLLVKTEKIDNTIRVSFKDNGPGIAEENLQRIFDPFFTTREIGKGTGLGLSICHGVVTEHGGKIWAESELGKGATFILELPVVTEAKRPKRAKSGRKTVRAAKARILVVDDEPVVRQLLAQLLIDEGHEVDTVDNGKDALDRIKDNRYSLILMDVKLPGMSGSELYERIQGIARSLAQRVVFITGDVMGAETEAFLIRTEAPYITKPFEIEYLRLEINRLLAKRPTKTAPGF